MLLALTFAISSFHFTTLEEYYTGGLYLGVGNGVSDGSAGVIALFIIFGIYGNAWTLNTAFWGLSFAKLLVLGVAISNMFIVLFCIRGVLVHQRKNLNEGDITGEHFVMT
jgi:hypothetical protein